MFCTSEPLFCIRLLHRTSYIIFMIMDDKNKFTSKQRFLRILSSLALLSYGRMLFPMAPLITEWDWAYDTLTEGKSTNLTVQVDEYSPLPQMSFKLIIVSTAYPISEILVSPIVGLIGHRYGYDFGVLIGLITALIMNILMSITSCFWCVLGARCLQGTSIAFLVSIGVARILEVCPTNNK